MAEKEVRLIDAIGLTETLAIVAKKFAKSDAQKSLMGRIMYIIEHKPTLYPLWHDAKTDPPKEPMEYIVMIKGGVNSTTLLYDGEKWFEERDDETILYHVTHWMPMPEPPKEVNHDL